MGLQRIRDGLHHRRGRMSGLRKRALGSEATSSPSPAPPAPASSSQPHKSTKSALTQRAFRVVFNCALLSLTVFVCFRRIPTTADVTNLSRRIGLGVFQDSSTTGGVRVFTKEELSRYSGESEKTYVALLGKVFDVSKGHYYKKDGGYGFFSGRDASRAYVTGQFDEAGLTDSVEDFDDLQRQELMRWQGFYDDHADYPFLGVLVGPFYDEKGRATGRLEEIERGAERAAESQKLQKEQESRIPSCSARGKKGKGSVVSCKEPRVPRKIDQPVVDGLVGQVSKRCACFLPKDLEQFEVEEYQGCDPSSLSCEIPLVG